MAAASASLDQAVGLVGLLLAKFPTPEQRPPDALTLAHARSARRLHRVAAWLWCGPDLAVLTRQTPFTAETAADLWEYYESLPLGQRPDRLLVFGGLVELLECSGVLTRERYPRIRRALDFYTLALAASCLAPRRVFYHLHRTFLGYERLVVRRECPEPSAPLPSKTDLAAVAGEALDGLREIIGVQSSSGRGTGAAGAGSWLPSLLASSLGLGVLVVYVLGVDRVRQAGEAAMNRWHPAARPRVVESEHHGFEIVPLPQSPG